MASVGSRLLAITPRPPEASAIQVGPTVREKDGRRDEGKSPVACIIKANTIVIYDVGVVIFTQLILLA